MPATAMPRDDRSRSSAGTSASMISRALAAQLAQLVLRGRVVVQVALGLADRAHAGSRRGSPGRRPGAPITYSVLPPPMSITSAVSVRRRPAVAPRKVSRASSSPEMVRASIPKRSRRSSANSGPFSASRTALVATATIRSAPWSSISRAVVLGDRHHALDRGVREPAGGVHALAQPGDVRPALELLELAVPHLGDQQPGRVGAQVDYRDPLRRHDGPA